MELCVLIRMESCLVTFNTRSKRENASSTVDRVLKTTPDFRLNNSTIFEPLGMR